MGFIPVYLCFRYRAVRELDGSDTLQFAPVAAAEPLDQDRYVPRSNRWRSCGAERGILQAPVISPGLVRLSCKCDDRWWRMGLRMAPAQDIPS